MRLFRRQLWYLRKLQLLFSSPSYKKHLVELRRKANLYIGVIISEISFSHKLLKITTNLILPVMGGRNFANKQFFLYNGIHKDGNDWQEENYFYE